MIIFEEEVIKFGFSCQWRKTNGKKDAFLFILLMTTEMTYSTENNCVSELIISLEKSALEKQNNKNPSGFLDLSSGDVVYFDPLTEKRLNGYGSFLGIRLILEAQFFVCKLCANEKRLQILFS